MKRLLAVASLAMALPCALSAQETPGAFSHNVAADFSQTSGAHIAFLPTDSAMVVDVSSAAGGFPNANATPTLVAALPIRDLGASPVGAAPEPGPAAPPNPKYLYGSRNDYRWQLGLGIAMVRFRSSTYYATAVGVNTDLAYFTNEWFAVEGAVTAAFAPTIALNEHVKFLGYDIGPKIVWRGPKWEPWTHILFGGSHIQPQIAGAGKNGYEIEAGGGVDYRYSATFAIRGELDWLRTGLFGQTQNSAQAVLGGVFHF